MVGVVGMGTKNPPITTLHYHALFIVTELVTRVQSILKPMGGRCTVNH